MYIDPIIKNVLIYSAVTIVIIALIIFGFILFKIYNIKKGIKKNNLDIISQPNVIEGYNKVIQRVDLGEPIFELKTFINNPLDDEIVEFTINTIIRNNFQKILMLGNKTAYEIIAISNKSKTTIDILSTEFNQDEYTKVITDFNFKHNINIIENPSNEYDLILLLSSEKDYLFFYNKYFEKLKEKGMFLIANTNLNKSWKKEIIKKLNNSNIKYDILKWYKGFILIVK